MMQISFKRLLPLAFASCGFISIAVGPAAASERPNIMLIVLDDVGFSDLGSYGSEIATPNIDALAANGIAFNNFHVTPTCSPTRAALLTGRDPHRVGMGLISRYDLGPSFPAFRGRINHEAGTLAQILKNDGLSTYAVGKWHLTPPRQTQAAGPFGHWPSGKGFDRLYGFLLGSTDQFAPELATDNQIIERTFDPEYVLTEDLVDNAITMLSNHRSYTPDRPFFMYLATPGMHAPHQASQSYLDEQVGKYAAGWDDIRAARFERQKELGIIPTTATLPERDARITPWNDLREVDKTVFAKFQETYAAMLRQTDHEIGRLLSQLDELGLRENTIIILLSDNGASQEGGVDGSINHTAYYNAIPETTDYLATRVNEIGGPGALPNYPLGWAQVSNTPFPYFKQDAAGGGITVPLIVSGLSGNDGKTQNQLRTQYHFATDLLPTVLDILDIELPTTLNGISQLPFDGRSMLYALDDADSHQGARTTQFYRMGHNRGIYHEGWMATAIHKKGDDYDDDVWALYNLDEDFSHARDLSSNYPEKLEGLKELWATRGEEIQLNASTMIDPQNPGFLNAAKILLYRSQQANFDELVLYPRTQHASEQAVPNILKTDYAITATIDRPLGTENGVLFAYGNHDSGLALHVKDNKLVFEYNYFANIPTHGTMYQLISDRVLPAGPTVVSMRFIATDDLQGRATLYIDDVAAGSLEMPKTIQSRMSHEGVDIGRDLNTPVGSLYSVPNQFEGTLRRVVIKTDG
ncbi:MAG: arylsulfatase [Kordiimonadaceae bacterium]|nr:arylsulfatase [Kordiimonadaceae bacterium]